MNLTASNLQDSNLQDSSLQDFRSQDFRSQDPGLSELSFVATEPIATLPFLRQRIQFRTTGDHQNLAGDLGRLAAQLKRDLRQPVLTDPYRSALVAPTALTPAPDAPWSVLDAEPVDLAAIASERLLFQACNYWWVRRFREQGQTTFQRVDPFRKRIYSTRTNTLASPQGTICAQRYLTYDFVRDRPGHIVLVLDFGNEYRAQDTLATLDWPNLPAGQRLIHQYDGRLCTWLGVAPVTAGEPCASLGNRSVIAYHCDRGHLDPAIAAQIDPASPLVLVQYPDAPEPFWHLPHLLCCLFDRRDLDPKVIAPQMLDIGEKFKGAIATVHRFNQWSRPEGDFLHFQTQPRAATAAQQLDRGRNQGNLDFGPDPQSPDRRILKSYPTDGVGNRLLLEKPDTINAALIMPTAWQSRAQAYSEQLRTALAAYGITLKRQSLTYDPLDPISLGTVCDPIKDHCHLAIACVPSSSDRLYDRTIDPYRTLKRILAARQLPSQMVTEKILGRGSDKYVNNNVLLGILAKLGYRAWQIHQMPGTADAFVGLDIGRKQGQTAGSAAFAIGRRGELLGWGSISVAAQGETFEGRSLRELLLTLATDHQRRYGRPLAHLVIHRDGTIKNHELELLQTLATDLAPHGLQTLDVVEIVKNHVCRAGMLSDTPPTWHNPFKGWIWEHCPSEALILTTGQREVKIMPQAAPRPLKIRRRHGSTDLLTLAAQVYWLSELHIGTTQTVRLPITTYYADRAATAALDGLAWPTLQTTPHLWFI